MKAPGRSRPEHHRRLTAPLRLLGVLGVLLTAFCGASPSTTEAAPYTVRQCRSDYTSDTDFSYFGVRPDAFFGVNHCAETASLGLHANAFKTVWWNDGNTYLAWAPDGTSFSGWKADFQGGYGTSDGVLLWARACFDVWCSGRWEDLFFGYQDWGTPKNKGWSGAGATTLQVQMLCTGWGGSDGCQFGPYAPGLVMYGPEITLDDAHPPAAPGLNGGTLLAGGWQRGSRSLDVHASDRGGGVAEIEVLIDGVARASRRPACAGPAYGQFGPAWTRLKPCPTEDSATIGLDLSDVADGSHAVQVISRDPSGQAASAEPFTAKVDNTPPGTPASAATDGGEGWRRHNDFDVHWENPVERHAPIAAAHWRLCPLGGGSCTSGRKVGHDVTRIDDLATTGSGEHDLAVWLEDEAGNQDFDRARHMRLRLDTEAPSLSFLHQDPSDPLRVAVAAHDTQSGVAEGEIEMRREGGASWHPLTTRLEGSRLVAVVDDEHFGSGSYELRARAVDGAGNEASTNRRDDGTLMTLRLPLRVEAHLRVGLPLKTRRGARHPVVRLQASGRVRFGRRVRLRGSLTNRDGQPIDGAPIHVYSKTRGTSSDFATVGLVRTDRRGRFSYLARASRSRILRFRYPGAPRIRAQTRDVVLEVPALSTIRASGHAVLVDDTVTFAGRVITQPVPRAGKLMEIQAFFRGRWRTFSTVRSDPRGRWRFAYRFGGTHGVVRYRFRMRIPVEAGYPFGIGGSRIAFVTVRGP